MRYDNITKEFLLDCFLNKKNIPEISKETNISEHSLRCICDKYNIKDLIYYKCKYCNTEFNLQFKKIKNKKIIHNVCISCSNKYRKTCKDLSIDEQNKIKEKRKKTYQIRYGLNGRPRTKKTTERIRQTKERRYGSPTYNNMEKQKQTMLIKYGVDHSSKLNTTYKRYSKISQEFFWEIYNNLPNDLKQYTFFAELNREFSCFNKVMNQRYEYDFVITNINFCMEFQGCYWHANPLIFDINEEDIIHNKKVKDIWLYDEIKEEYIRNEYRYDFMDVWDYEYLENKQKTISDALYAISWNYRKYILKTIHI
jgi:hypothetical protein